MNEKDLSKDNSKKLIIGISIFFCAVILIIGATTAYFTQSDTKETGNIVSTDQVTLHYADNDDYMFGNLIPINEDKVEYAYNREGNLKCKDDAGYNVCSIYQFTITNTGNVVQDIIINLETKVNGFTNLKFKLYDLATNKEVPTEKNSLSYNTEEEILLVNDLTLDTSNNKSNTYELVFYIKNDPDNDQSHLDSGKRFGAKIKVNSITTGMYIEEGFGEEDGCWRLDDEDSSKLAEFTGFDENDEIKKECETYFKEDNGYYILNIPSTYGGSAIKTISNQLFFGYDFDERGIPTTPNKYNKIKSITINDGITTIEDGVEVGEEWVGAFSYIGFDLDEWTITHTVTLNLPNSLNYIGDYAFYANGIESLTLPSNLQTIGNSAFGDNNITTNEAKPLIIPESVISIRDSAFVGNYNLTKLSFAGSLTEILEDKKLTFGTNVFNNCDLVYNIPSNPLELPARIQSIGWATFIGDLDRNDELLYIRYHGSKDIFEKFPQYWIKDNVYAKVASEYEYEVS